MVSNSFSWNLFHKIPIIGIMRNIDEDKISKITSLYLSEGLTNLEITLNSPKAIESIADLTRNFGSLLNIGAGTVCTLAELEMALSAGAGFIVTPILNREIIVACVKEKIPVFPGAYTPTEIYEATSLGATMVKVFPASQLGPQYIKDLLGPLPDLKLLPTGGINLNNMQAYFKAGATGLGIGSQLFPEEIVQNEKWKDLQLLFSRFYKSID